MLNYDWLSTIFLYFDLVYQNVKVRISRQVLHFYTKLGSDLSNLCPKECSKAFLYFFDAVEFGNRKSRPCKMGDWDL